MSDIKLTLSGLNRYFKDVKALDDFNLEVKKGELVSLLGPSGCGKTTALRIIAGLDKQDSGSVNVGGQDISNIPANKRNMGMVFQAYSLFPNLTALENVTFGLKMRKVESKIRYKRASNLLELVGLPNHANRFAHQLSGGQQQRVALARALAYEPEILLLDEPLSALDAQVRAQVREEIRRIQLDLGITTIFVTHDQEEAMSISDRVAVMNSGRLEQIDLPDEIYKKPNSPFVASFVGQINRLPVELSDNNKVMIFNKNLEISSRSIFDLNSDEIYALIRPEDFQLTHKDEANFAGTIALKSFLGPNTVLGVSVTNMPLIHIYTDSFKTETMHIGDEVFLKLNIHEVMVQSK